MAFESVIHRVAAARRSTLLPPLLDRPLHILRGRVPRLRVLALAALRGSMGATAATLVPVTPALTVVASRLKWMRLLVRGNVVGGAVEARSVVIVVVVPGRTGSLVRLLGGVLVFAVVPVVRADLILVPILVHLYGFLLGGALVRFATFVVLEELVALAVVMGVD